MHDKDPFQIEYSSSSLSRAEELEEECEEYNAIREEMHVIYDADGLTFTHPDE